MLVWGTSLSVRLSKVYFNSMLNKGVLMHKDSNGNKHKKSGGGGAIIILGEQE